METEHESLTTTEDSEGPLNTPADPSVPPERALPAPDQLSGKDWAHAHPLRLARLADLWATLRRWIQANTFYPSSLPQRWPHTLTAYAAVLVLQGSMTLVALLLDAAYPQFAFPGVLEVLAVVLVALTFGAGPSIVATVLGVILTELVLLPPRFAWQLTGPKQIVEVLLLLAVGLAVSLTAGRTERTRRRAAALAGWLAVERARLEAVLEAVADPLTIHDRQGRFLRVNRAALALTEPEVVTMEDLHARYDIRTPSGQPLPLDAFPVVRALRGETVSDIEMQYGTADGQERVVTVSAAPFRNAASQIDGVVAVTHDVTALRVAERAAADQTRQLQAVFEAMRDGIFFCDSEGRVVLANTAARRMLDLDANPADAEHEQEIREGSLTPRHTDGPPSSIEQQALRRILRGEVFSGDQPLDAVFTRHDGREAHLSFTGAPLYDDGRIVGAVAIGRDVTEPRRLERRTRQALEALLQMAEALVQAPTEIAPEANGELAPNDVARRLVELTCSVIGCERVTILAIDPATERLRPIAAVGFSSEQEQQWRSALPQLGLSDYETPAERAQLRAGAMVVSDLRGPAQRGRPTFDTQSALVAPVCLGGQLIGILTVSYGPRKHDYTPEDRALAGAAAKLTALVLERERLLGEREEARADALAFQKANRRMDEFLSIASHELRTPLTALKTSLQVVERRTRHLVAEAEETESGLAEQLASLASMLLRATSAADRQQRLINDLLDVSRIQTGKLELRPEPLDLAALVRQVVDEQQLGNPSRTITLDLPAEPVPIMADQDRIGQVATNYLTNALKYAPEEHPIHVAVRVDQQEARVSVQDGGPGLPADEQELVWNRFHRAPGISQQSGSGIGLGLGLFICKSIIEAHGGTVGVQSAPGAGSTFWFTLPLER